jgi:hypothetical protein
MINARALLLASTILFGWANAEAQSALSIRVRGTVTGFDGHELQVQTRDGKNLNVSVIEATKFKAIVALKMRDIKQGGFVGITAIPRTPGGPLLAREVHVFGEAQRGLGEGHYAWDLEPGSTMTNANVDAIVNTHDGKELTLSYKGGSKKIIVPRNAPVVSFQPADKSILKAGAQIFCIALEAADGSLTAQHISVGMNGMKPPM